LINIVEIRVGLLTLWDLGVRRVFTARVVPDVPFFGSFLSSDEDFVCSYNLLSFSFTSEKIEVIHYDHLRKHL
jgi:hypothetical protein